jgi:hypothetical protein
LQASSTRREFTSSVVVCRKLVVVARFRVGATTDRLDASSIIVCSQSVVVQRCRRSATWDFIAVTNVVTVCILEAIAGAVSSFLRENTRTIIDLGFGVVVAGLKHGTARGEAGNEIA